MTTNKYIKQNTSGILYDLDLMPDQCKTKKEVLMRQVITELRNEIERLQIQLDSIKVIMNAADKNL